MTDTGTPVRGEQTSPWSYSDARWFAYRLLQALRVQGDRRVKTGHAVLFPSIAREFFWQMRRDACLLLGGEVSGKCSYWNPANNGYQNRAACFGCRRPLCTRQALAALINPAPGYKPALNAAGQEFPTSTDIKALDQWLGARSAPAISTVRLAVQNAQVAGIFSEEDVQVHLGDLRLMEVAHGNLVHAKRLFEENWKADRLGEHALCFTWLDSKLPFTFSRREASWETLETIPPEDFGLNWFTAQHPNRPEASCGRESYFMNWGKRRLMQYVVVINEYPCPIDKVPKEASKKLAVRMVLRPFERVDLPHKNATIVS